MKNIANLFYTVWSKIIIVLLIMFCMLQTGISFAATTVMYRDNPLAVKNVLQQWDSYDYKTSEFLNFGIETAIDSILQYSLYYRRDTVSDDQFIVNADDNYQNIIALLDSFDNFSYAVVNHTTNRIISNIPEINYTSSSADVRSHFPLACDTLLIIRDAHNPYYENGTITKYTQYISKLAESYSDNFDLYIDFGENFSFIANASEFEESHNETLSRLSVKTRLAAVYIAVSTALFLILIMVTGKQEVGGKIYPGLSDTLANDLKLILFTLVIIAMGALYQNSLHMALRAETLDLFLPYSSDFYIFRSYVSLMLESCIIIALCCTLKRQYKLGTLFTNTYIYQLFINPEKDK